ncbi:MAG: NAD(P)/FAD-dependent oxidoreductase [Verrucomicrobiales bacterium]
MQEVTVTGFGLAGAWVALALRERGVAVRVVDAGGGSTEVAAGLVNPLAGRNFEPSRDWDAFWPEALAGYRDLEKASGRRLFYELPILRKWLDAKDRRKFEKKRDLLTPWLAEVGEEGVVWRGGGWLDTRAFLAAAREVLGEEPFRVGGERPGLRVFCTGARGLLAGEYAAGGHRCAKGEILTLRVPGLREDRILNGGGWVIPTGDGLFRAGATYAWDGLESGPTREGREKVEKMARFLIGERDFEIVAHVAGVRPIIHRSEPVIWRDEAGWHLNGLGSKGVIYAPGTARRLVERLVSEGILDE